MIPHPSLGKPRKNIYLTLTTMPPSTNHMYGNRGGRGGIFLKPEVRAAKEAMGWEARAQYRGEPMAGPLKVEVYLFWPDNRKHDTDNNKALFDALNGIVWLDDGQIFRQTVEKFLGQANPHVEIIVSPYTPKLDGNRRRASSKLRAAL